MTDAQTGESAEIHELHPETSAEKAAPTHEETVASLEEQIAKLKDQFIRAVAETDNLRKRAERDQQETAKYATANFARDMVNVLENVKRAAESLTPEKRASNELINTIGEGMDMTLAELTGIFTRHGIKQIEPMGQKFDHNLHQAVAQLDHPEAEAQTVLQVVQAGFMLHDRLLRPAMVAVAKGAGAAAKLDTSA